MHLFNWSVLPLIPLTALLAGCGNKESLSPAAIELDEESIVYGTRVFSSESESPDSAIQVNEAFEVRGRLVSLSPMKKLRVVVLRVSDNGRSPAAVGGGTSPVNSVGKHRFEFHVDVKGLKHAGSYFIHIRDGKKVVDETSLIIASKND